MRIDKSSCLRLRNLEPGKMAMVGKDHELAFALSQTAVQELFNNLWVQGFRPPPNESAEVSKACPPAPERLADAQLRAKLLHGEVLRLQRTLQGVFHLAAKNLSGTIDDTKIADTLKRLDAAKDVLEGR